MSWEPEIRSIADRRQRSRELGGPERVQRQHDRGQVTIRRPIDSFLDPGTFREVGQLAAQVRYDADHRIAEYTPAGYVGGTGRVDGRRVVVGGSDFTVRGGSSEGGHGVRSK